jgi:hypothetical protein
VGRRPIPLLDLALHARSTIDIIGIVVIIIIVPEVIVIGGGNYSNRAAMTSPPDT